MRTFVIAVALLALWLPLGAAAAWAEEPPVAPPVAPAPPPPAIDAIELNGTAIEVPPAPPPAPARAVVGDCGGCGACNSCCKPCCDPCARSLDLQFHAALVNGLEGPLLAPTGLPNEVVWDDLDYGIALGGRAAYHWCAYGPWTATVGATWWGSWDDSRTTTGVLGASATPGAPVNVSPVFNVNHAAETTLWGIDIDLSRDVVCTPCLTAGWGWGLRYVRFDEDIDVSFFQGAVLSEYSADVRNGLLAAQLCGHAVWKLSDRWDLCARGAGFAGWLHQEVSIAQANFFPVGPPVEDDDIGFGAELEVEARWHLCRGWSLGVGYGLLLLFDQARAEQAFDLSQTGTGAAQAAIVEDTILAHRLFVGVTYDF